MLRLPEYVNNTHSCLLAATCQVLPLFEHHALTAFLEKFAEQAEFILAPATLAPY